MAEASLSTPFPVPLDLHELAVLANYERASTDPRFRHAKLREVAFDSHFRTVKTANASGAPGEDQGDMPSRAFFFDQPEDVDENERDLPANMMHSGWDETPLGTKEMETIYWEMHGHDGCYKGALVAKMGSSDTSGS
jgi:hypothetical protein